jgi:hypothetical protein
MMPMLRAASMMVPPFGLGFPTGREPETHRVPSAVTQS